MADIFAFNDDVIQQSMKLIIETSNSNMFQSISLSNEEFYSNMAVLLGEFIVDAGVTDLGKTDVQPCYKHLIPDLSGDHSNFYIHIIPDKSKITLGMKDYGIGMTKHEPSNDAIAKNVYFSDLDTGDDQASFYINIIPGKATSTLTTDNSGIGMTKHAPVYIFGEHSKLISDPDKSEDHSNFIMKIIPEKTNSTLTMEESQVESRGKALEGSCQEKH